MLNEDASLAGKKICVTGATGFLGSHLLPRLAAAGAEITCLCRKSADVSRLGGGIRIVTGDCESGSGLKEALADQDLLIHMAGRLFGLGWRDYLEANTRIAGNIIAAMGEKKPAKTIFVSSLAAAGPGANPPGVSETAIPAPVSAYGWSKLLCEKIFASCLGDTLVILRPAIIYGSGDKGLLPLFRSARHGLTVSPGLFRHFPISAIHADDAADAILLACQPGSRGIYHLADGEAYDMDSFCKAMGAALGRGRLYIAHMPLAVMCASAALGSAWGQAARKVARLFRREWPPPHWNFDKYRESREAGWLADSTRIRRELGFRPQLSLADGMAEAVAGYRARGWL